jgi:hypothetical protein
VNDVLRWAGIRNPSPKPKFKPRTTCRRHRRRHVADRRPATLPQFKNIFPGLRIPRGSSACFTERLGAVLLLQKLALADPHAVLAAARPAQRQRARDDLLVEVPGAPRASPP